MRYTNKKRAMNPLDTHEILMWLAIIAIIVLVSITGMCINRVYIHRAHRKALAELRRRVIDSAMNCENTYDIKKETYNNGPEIDSATIDIKTSISESQAT